MIMALCPLFDIPNIICFDPVSSPQTLPNQIFLLC